MPRRRYELTDEQYERIEPLLPEVEGRGCPYNDHRKVINGIFWILRSGAPWRDVYWTSPGLVDVSSLSN
ncbi:transposase [Salinibacter ruber]|nr:transposase [Salinibacter ruber]